MTREQAEQEIRDNFTEVWAEEIIKTLKGESTDKNDSAVDCIDRAELLKDIDTCDKFGYTAKYGLERLDKDDKDFVAYVKYNDVVNCINNMPLVELHEPRLISVKEGLPKEGTAVLVWCPERKNNYCAYLEDKQWWIFGASHVKVDSEVTAWIPLSESCKA